MEGREEGRERNLIPDSGEGMFLLRMCEPTTTKPFREMINKQRQEQDQTPRTYRMTIDWQPPETFKASAMRAGVDASLLTEAVLEKFRNHYAEGQECTTGQWVNKLIDWLKRENVSQQERPQSAQNQNKTQGRRFPLVLQPAIAETSAAS